MQTMRKSRENERMAAFDMACRPCQRLGGGAGLGRARGLAVPRDVPTVPEQDTQQNQKTARELHSEIEYSGQADGPDHREHHTDRVGNVGQVTVHHAPGDKRRGPDLPFSMAAYQNAVGSGVGTERCRHGKAHDFREARHAGQAPHQQRQHHMPLAGLH